MTAKLTIEIDIKAIRKFAALADIDLSGEDEAKIIGSTTAINGDDLNEVTGDSQASLVFAWVIIAKQLEDKE